MPTFFRHQKSERVHYQEPTAVSTCSQWIHQALSTLEASDEKVCVCIGTDRSTGDALGPLVGSLLQKKETDLYSVYGTLDQPVHALNLPQTLQQIEEQHPQAALIAIDACLGKAQSVGQIQVGLGPIKPGAAVNKSLPEVGHVHVTGIVNLSGYMEFFILQNTRLQVVMAMAEVIASATHQALSAPRTESTILS